MTPLLAWLVATALASAGTLALWPRLAGPLGGAMPTARGALLACSVLGSSAALLAFALERALGRWTGVDARAEIVGDAGSVLATLALVAPLEEALTLAVAQIGLRRRGTDAVLGAAWASVVAIGFAAGEAVLYLGAHGHGRLAVLRVVLALPAHVFSAGVWGAAAGRARARGLGMPMGTWLAATWLHGLYDHLAFGRSALALLGLAPLLVAMLAVTAMALREADVHVSVGRGRPSGRHSRLPSLPPPPSLSAVRAALRRSERPVSVRWIVGAALVTNGMVMALVAAAIVGGRRFGVDFAAIDEGAPGSTAAVTLLASAALVAYPLAGWVVARASGHDAVLEPALGAVLAIGGTLVALGIAAPVALVFAVASAPVAVGLACLGAWIGGS